MRAVFSWLTPDSGTTSSSLPSSLSNLGYPRAADYNRWRWGITALNRDKELLMQIGYFQLAQVLPTPEHFEQASELVTEELATADIPCGPDVDTHVKAIEAYAEAGFDELYVNQIGPDQEAFFAAYREHVLPRVQGKW